MRGFYEKILCLLLVIITIISTCSIGVSAKSNVGTDNDSVICENYFPKDYIGYRYPILPGTSEWRKLENHQQMVDACQIPEEVYQSMTTEELAQTVLAYPLNADMFAYDTYKMGFETVREHFDGLQEFCARDDNASVLMDLYSNQKLKQENINQDVLRTIQSDGFIATTISEKIVCKQIFDSLVFSLFLTQDTFVEKMSPENKQELSNAICDLNAIIYQELSDDETQTSISAGTMATATPIEFIGFDSSSGGKKAISSTTVKTPKGGSMTAYTMNAMEVWLYSDGEYYIRQLSELSSNAKASLNSQYYDIYGINPISAPSVKYNCHSYAWYKQTNPNYWINTFSTDGYTSVNKLEVEVNGIMVYYLSNNGTYTSPNHSAIITSITYHPRSKVTFVVKSKWGMCGLYEHGWENCPYYYINKSPCDLKYYNG